MRKSFRFLLQFTWVNLGAVLAFAVIVLIGSYLTGVPTGTNNLFATYYSSFPLMALLMVFMYSFALCTNNLILALSLGDTRRNFFWGIQGILGLYTIVCWVLQLVMSAIPPAFGWTEMERWRLMLSLGGLSPFAYPLIFLSIVMLGCVCGLLFERSKLIGGTVMFVSIFLAIICMIVLMVRSNHKISLLSGLAQSDNVIVATLFSSPGGVPMILLLGTVLCICVCEGLILRTVSRAVVR